MTHPNDTRTGPNPSGICHCGCGLVTPLAKVNNARLGWIKGEHQRYCRGHTSRYRVSPVDWIEEDRGYTTPCWIWQRARKEPNSYGAIEVDGRLLLAHREVYKRLRGPIPDGKQLDHLCRQRPCVNPDHLEPVTNAENTQRAPHMKFTPDDVRAIRSLVGVLSRTELAQRYGVRYYTICNIINRKTWGNIE